MKTSREINASSMNNRRSANEAQFMFSLETFYTQTKSATQQSTQYEFILMSLNLNEIINKFLILSIITNKRSHSQEFVDVSSTISQRSISVMQINNSQSNVNFLTILRYRFKSSSRLKRFFKKSFQTSYQSNLNTQNTQNENE